MIIAPAALLADLQQAIVKATHGLVDQDGSPIMVGTIDNRRLEMAALAGLQIAAGEVIWPGNKQIDPPRRVRDTGPFGAW